MHFIIPGISYSVIVGVMSCGEIESVPPTVILNIL